MSEFQMNVEKIVKEGEEAFKQFRYKQALDFFNSALDEIKSRKVKTDKWYIYWQLGKVLRKIGDFDNSILNLESALKEGGNSLKKIEYARILNDLGLTFEKIGYADKALDKFNKALPIFKKEGNSKDLGAIYSNFSLAFIAISEFEEAEKYLNQAQNFVEESGDIKLKGVNLNNRGVLYGEWGKFEKALSYQIESLEIFKQLKDKREEANSLHNIAGLYNQLGNTRKARSTYEKSLQISSKIEEKRLEATTLSSLGVVFQDLGLYKKAEDCFSEVEKIVEDVKDLRLKTGIYIAIGTLQQKQGNYKIAEGYFRKSLKLSKKYKFSKAEASSNNGLAAIFHEIGDYNKSINFLDKALEIQYQLENQREIGAILNNLALSNYHLGNYDKSIQINTKALEYLELTKNKLGIATSLDNIGHVFYIMNRTEDALEYHMKASGIFEEIENEEGKGRTYNNIGIIYQNQQKSRKALEFFDKALKIHENLDMKKGVAATLLNIGTLLMSQNRFEDAEDNLFKSLHLRIEINDKSGISAVLNNIGSLYIKKKEFKTAYKYYKKSLLISRRIGNKRLESTTLLNISDLFAIQKQFPKALHSLKKCFYIIDYLDSLAPSSKLRIEMREKTSINVINRIIASCVKLDLIEEALAYSEFIKCREMIHHGEIQQSPLDEKYNSYIEQLNRIDEKIRDINFRKNKIQLSFENELITMKKYNSSIETLVKELERLETRRRKLRDEIWINFPTKGILFPSDPVKLIKQLKKHIISNWIILEYHYNILTEEMYIFILEEKTKTRVIKYKLSKEKQLKVSRILVETLNDYKNTKTVIMQNLVEKNLEINFSNIQEELEWFYTKLENNFKSLSKKLCTIYFPNELKNFLASKKNVFLSIIPTGTMHNFPIETIWEGDNYIGLKYNLSRAFNLQTLIAAIQSINEKSVQKALVVGNPTEGIEKSLLDAKDEAEFVIGILKKHNYDVRPLIGTEANLSDFIDHLKQNRCQIIHFAGHAEFRGDNPELSSLIFREGKEKALLKGNMFPLKINLENNPLLVLSACETGLVSVKQGDEIYGLARGIIESGCFNLVLTGWDVFDDSTREFFEIFYTEFSKQKPISTSLKLARKHSLKKNKEEELIKWGTFRHYGIPFQTIY